MLLENAEQLLQYSKVKVFLTGNRIGQKLGEAFKWLFGLVTNHYPHDVVNNFSAGTLYIVISFYYFFKGRRT